MLDTLTQSNLKLRKGTMALNNQNHSPIPDDTYHDPKSPPERESPLVYVSKTKIYDIVREEAGQRRERRKSQLRRKKDGKRPKSAALNRARMEILKSALSDQIVRPNSAASELSILSQQSDENEPKIIYDKNGEIIYPPKRTRAVSRMHERMEERKKSHNSSIRCPYPQCKDFNDALHKYDINLIHNMVSSHLDMDHRHKSLYKCDFCPLEYCTKELYNIHIRDHDDKPVWCGRCGVEQKNVETFQRHMDEHFKSSFKCHLCDLDFITKMECNGHIFSVHHERKMYKKKELKIIKKIHYKKQPRSKKTHKNTKYRTATISIQSQPEDTFRPRPFTELAYLLKRRFEDVELDDLLDEPKPMRLYGEPVIHNKELPENLVLNPQTNNKDDEAPLTFKHFPNSKRKKPSLSGRSTPFLGSMPVDDDEEFDLTTLTNSDWFANRRELESRNEEIAGLFGEQSDMDATSSKSRSPLTCSEVDDDFETESHDLDLSSIENDYENSMGS